MESDVTQSALYYKTWAWFETHKRQVVWGFAGVLALGVIIGFVVWRQNEKQVSASEALSRLVVQGSLSGQPASAESFLKLADEHPNTDAAARALLIAAERLFTDGKYAEAQAQFEKFLRDHSKTDFAGQAAFGVAACFDAMGKTNDAVRSYREIAERRSNESVGPQAKLALALLFEAQGDFKQAHDTYQQLARADLGSLGRESGIRMEELLARHPELAQPETPVTNAVAPLKPAP